MGQPDQISGQPRPHSAATWLSPNFHPNKARGQSRSTAISRRAERQQAHPVAAESGIASGAVR